MRTRSLLYLFAFLTLSACGIKGALVMPPAPKPLPAPPAGIDHNKAPANQSAPLAR